MAGGTWETQNKVRPGAYINFESAGSPGISLGERGTVALPLALPWGPEKEVLTIHAGDTGRLFTLLGYTLADPELLLLREAFKKARTVLLYRLNTGTKAAVVVGTLTVTARHSGVRGNDIMMVIQRNILDNNKWDVITHVGALKRDEQTVSGIADLVANDFVVFSGSGSLTATAGASLTGGANGTVTALNHTEFLGAVETHSFNTICYPGTDVAVKELYKMFTARLRDQEGVKFQCVLAEMEADYEGVISVLNGVILEDGAVLPAEQAAVYVAAAAAGARINQSLTYARYEGAAGLTESLTNSEIQGALLAGQIVFTAKRDRNQNTKVVIEQDINTFVSFTPEKNKIFSKNRPVRTLDQLNNDLRKVIEGTYIGKVNNNEDGRNLVKADVHKYLQELERMAALTNVRLEDINITIGHDIDAIVADIAVQPVDAMEKFYIRIEVR